MAVKTAGGKQAALPAAADRLAWTKRMPGSVSDPCRDPADILWLLKEPAGKTTGMAQAGDLPRQEAEDPPVCCAACLHRITGQQARIAVGGAFSHTFANPHGQVFTIGCFSSAPGCGIVGPAEAEFSWFSGHTWQIVVCGKCLGHLGWRFCGPDHSFYGLILAALANA